MIGIDIGNTTVKFAKFDNNKLRKVYRVEKERISKKAIRNILAKFKKDKLILLCSVVPEINHLFFNLTANIYIVGKDFKVPVKCRYDKNKVGPDRLVAAYAARKSNPSTRLILDFGTAITLDFLAKKGDYLGGVILPGISSTLKTFKNCALLPDSIKIKKTEKLIPKNTSESINKGLQEGFSLMVNSLVKKYQDELKLTKNDKILVTGGDFLILKPYIDFNFCYKKHLVLEGLVYLYQDCFNF